MSIKEELQKLLIQRRADLSTISKEIELLTDEIEYLETQKEPIDSALDAAIAEAIEDGKDIRAQSKISELAIDHSVLKAKIESKRKELTKLREDMRSKFGISDGDVLSVESLGKFVERFLCG